jgi:tetratricopeptide (TPR) repeat protein
MAMETPIITLPKVWPEVSDEVAELFESEASQHPTWADVQNRWGLVLLARRRFEEARIVFARALDRNPRYAWAALNHLQTLALRGDVDAARAQLDQATLPAPGGPEFARAFLALCQDPATRRDTTAWLSPEIGRRPDYLRLEAALLAHTDPAAARRSWEESAAHYPAPIPGWMDPLHPGSDRTGWLLSFVPGLHQLMKDASTWEARLGHSSDAARLADCMLVFWYDLGAAWCQRGFLAGLDADEAGSLAAYQRAAEEAPTSPEPWIALAYLWSAQGDLARADEALRQSLDRAPGYADLHYQRGLLDRARGDADAALRSFRIALKQNPQYLVARLQEAETLFALEHWRESRASFTRVIDGGLESVDVWLRVGQVEERLGHTAQAEVAYRRGCELDPQSAFPHFHLGHLYRDRGERDKAKRAWRRFLDLAGNSEEANAIRAEMEEGNEP